MMENIIFWVIGILLYLLIGYGVEFDSDSREKKRGIEFIVNVLVWPFEFGCLISRASVYCGSKFNISMSYESMGNRYGALDPTLQEVFEVKLKVAEIEKILHNIENMAQKDNDKK
jgi:hypothetical protein